MRGATAWRRFHEVRGTISTHTPHAGRDLDHLDRFGCAGISTHTPHAGRDYEPLNENADDYISTHTPHAGRDFVRSFRTPTSVLFQLTRPMRGATIGTADYVANYVPFQLTRPMRGATLTVTDGKILRSFQLTRPMRGATDALQREPPSA